MPGVGGTWIGTSLRNKMPTVNDHVLLESAARVASGNSGDLVGFAPYTSATFTLRITADESTSADKLNVYIQRKLPDGTYEDIAAFNQALGDAGNTGIVGAADVYSGAAGGSFVAAPLDAALTAGTVADKQWGDVFRIKWVIVDDSASASFTFEVKANLRV